MSITPDDVTVADFKAQFYRGFVYLPVWLNTTIYNTGDYVFYEATQLFYTCKSNGVTAAPINGTYWTVTPGNKYDYVWDQDIENAFSEAKLYYNVLSNMNDSSIKITFLYLSAHFLVGDLKAGGTTSGFQTLVGSRGVGNVNESYVIPDWMKKESLTFFTTTYYGYKYLTLTRPYRIGNLFPVFTPRHALPNETVPSYLTGQY